MTKALYYDDAYQTEFSATVVECSLNNDHYEIVLDQTLFYPEGGGQGADIGYLDDAYIYDVHKKDDEIYHYSKEEVEVGKTVVGKINFDHRFDMMQQHSGEHIFSGFICQKYDCDNVGFHLGDKVVTVDYDHDISLEEALEIEKESNLYISKNVPVNIFYPKREELKNYPFRFKKEIEGDIRIVEFKGADICACCGTHVNNSSEVMMIKLLSCKKYKNGTRIEIVSGLRAYDYLLENWRENMNISKALSAQHFETSVFVDNLINTNIKLKQQIAKLLDEKNEQVAESYKGKEDVLLITDEMDSINMKKFFEKLVENVKGYVCLFSKIDNGYRYMINDAEGKVLSSIADLNTALNGKGGGKNGFAQGSVNCTKETIEEYFKNK